MRIKMTMSLGNGQLNLIEIRMHKVKLWGQLKHLGGSEYVDVADSATVDDLVMKIADQKEEIAHMLVSEGQPNHSILFL